MPTQLLTLESLRNLDRGKVAALFDRGVELVIRDMVSRPGDATRRVVTLEFGFVPVGADGVCDECRVDVVQKVKLPNQRTREYSMEVNARGQASFRADSLDDVRQTTFTDLKRDDA